MEKPGICTKETVMNEADQALFLSTAIFINGLHSRVADMGCINAKSIYMGCFFNINIEQVEGDFNFWTTPQGYIKAFDFVLCLEVLEHVQNQLLFIQNVRRMLKPGGILFLSLPARPRFLWVDYHFFEMNKKHLTKWILNPLGLEIIDCKRLRIGHPWCFYFTGIRPFFRIFLNYTFIYKIKSKCIKVNS